MRLPALILAASLIVLIAGCGGNDQTIVPSASTDTPSSAPVASNTSAPATVSRAPTPSPSPESGTRENPAPIGTVLDTGGGWQITVISVTPDANAAIQAGNQFNDPPEAGNEFFMATVSAKYTGTTSGTFDGSYALRSVGASNVSYSTFENSCGVVPDGFKSSEVFTGGVIQGNVCWQVKVTDAASLVLFYNPSSLRQGNRIYLALH